MFSSEYNFFATTEDNYGILESEPIEEKFKTDNEPSDIEISDFSVRSSGDTAEGTVKPGDYTVNVNIGNYSANSFNSVTLSLPPDTPIHTLSPSCSISYCTIAFLIRPHNL